MSGAELRQGAALLDCEPLQSSFCRRDEVGGGAVAETVAGAWARRARWFQQVLPLVFWLDRLWSSYVRRVDSNAWPTSFDHLNMWSASGTSRKVGKRLAHEFTGGGGESFMRSAMAAAILALALAGCATSPGPPRGNGTFVDVIGTPLLIALKIPTCVASIVIAAPIAGASRLADPGDIFYGPDLRRDLDDGLIQNCGPPYVVTTRWAAVRLSRLQARHAFPASSCGSGPTE